VLLRGQAKSLADRWLPAAVFGALSIGGAAGVLRAASRGPVDGSGGGWLAAGLDCAALGLMAGFCGLIATLFLSRRAPQGARAGPLAVGVALAGTFGMNATQLQAATTQDWRVLVAGDLLVIGGVAFAAYAAISLGECFGLAAEARGFTTAGAYRVVRHPLYLGELVAAVGVLLPVLSVGTATVFGAFCLCQGMRAVLEERVLVGRFPEYAAYRRRTPALVPWPRPKPTWR
jgi:protein-S-isoprenylcysteine O-methyltransferase Ste14